MLRTVRVIVCKSFDGDSVSGYWFVVFFFNCTEFKLAAHQQESTKKKKLGVLV